MLLCCSLCVQYISISPRKSRYGANNRCLQERSWGQRDVLSSPPLLLLLPRFTPHDQTVTEYNPCVSFGRNAQIWHCYSFWPVQTFPWIASSCRQETSTQPPPPPPPPPPPAAASVSVLRPAALNNSLHASEAETSLFVFLLGRLQRRRIPKTFLSLLYGARRKHLRRFYGTSADLEARRLIVTCCWGNSCSVSKYFTQLFCFFWDGNPSGTARCSPESFFGCY